AATAVRFPSVPVIVPHFGAGFFREALMAAELCPNVHLDTSSSNSWVKYVPGLTLTEVFRRALAVAGPNRLIFRTASSVFPRGWRGAVLRVAGGRCLRLPLDGAWSARWAGGRWDTAGPIRRRGPRGDPAVPD